MWCGGMGCGVVECGVVWCSGVWCGVLWCGVANFGGSGVVWFYVMICVEFHKRWLKGACLSKREPYKLTLHSAFHLPTLTC